LLRLYMVYGESKSKETQTAPHRAGSGLDSPLSPTGARGGDEVRTMAKRNLYDFAEARCAKFLDMMMDYEEILATLDEKAGAQ
jgi:hypothetical protein